MKEYTPAAKTPTSAYLDYYKYTMGNVILERHPDVEVTFTLKNRNSQHSLSEYVSVDDLERRTDEIRSRGFTAEEVAYLAGLKAQDGTARFTESYLDHLLELELPPVAISLDTTGDLAIDTSGPWADVSLWETVIMSEINEMYYRNLLEAHNLTLDDLYAEGDRRLNEKITTLRQRPGIKFADFGTRRRFSLGWHEHVIARLKSELPTQFVGTSNPYFAYKYNLSPVGTFAHEMPMIYAALEDATSHSPLRGHTQMLQDWQESYRGDLSIALTDTFGSDFFFADFSEEQAEQWTGLRHDSGDPVEFGEKAIQFYTDHHIDPTTKTIVFSDGLDVETITALYDHFSDRITVLFGWGTDLMNDLGLPANNFVMKATSANGTPTVKLSDDKGKHTGPDAAVARYQQLSQERVPLPAPV